VVEHAKIKAGDYHQVHAASCKLLILQLSRALLPVSAKFLIPFIEILSLRQGKVMLTGFGWTRRI
jgi:hypothetical protein